ncbi:MAG: DUF192 domain-containing protein [bacterium]|nr:DUF192 domain-containing protein [bacterium]
MSPKTLPTISLTILLLIIALLFVNSKRETGFVETEYVLEGKTRRVLVADTPEKWERGLMDYRKDETGITAWNSRELPEGIEGMLFVSSGKVFRAFWNKNTFLDLDLYWVSGDKVIGKSFLPSIEKSKDIVTVSSPEAVDKVVEIITGGYQP